jgi:hypothetical protein
MAAAKERKTTKNKASVAAFLCAIENAARRADGRKLAKIMQSASGQRPAMWGAFIVGFGAYHYRLESGTEGDAPVIAFSPRGQNFSLYHMDFQSNGPLLERLGKYKTGKKCMYITRLSDIDLKVLEDLCARSFAGVGRAHERQAAP